MKTLLILAGIMFGGTLVAQAADDAVKLSPAWQGHWQVFSMKSGDIELPEAFVKAITVDVAGAEMVWKVNNQQIKAQVKFIGTEDNPKPIDIVGVGGDNDGRLYEGIYDLSDDTLKLCLNTTTDVKNRPVEFDAPAGSTFVVIQMRKEKK